MKNSQIVMLVATSALALTSCSKLGKLSADNFTVTPTPLEAIGGEVPATINGTFPEKYMKKKAVVTVIPVLKYEGGEAEARKKRPDKYIVEFERRIGNASEVTPGFTDDAGTLRIDPELDGAIGVTLTGVSLYVSVSFDSTDGLKAHYQFKTKGANTGGTLTDITFAAKASS